ncbi:MAG: ISKra4 family transposase [Chloroflexota bacterium]|nr:ISKra4 family transposase [Chloroflexota bacterium]
MDRTELSSAIIQEMQAVVGEALEAVMPTLLTADLATLEQRVQQVGRVILGGLIERVAAGHAQGLPRPARCPACHGGLKRRERARDLVGLVGDYTLRRAYYWCAACKRGTAPLDAALGLGPGKVSPGLARVVARVAVEATFTPAAEQVHEALGATLSDETARRLAERIGAAAEAQTQAAIGRAQRGQVVWTQEEVERAEDTTILAVEVDGVLVHQEAGWHEMKVATVAPLGPDLSTDPETTRTHLAWGTASYGVGAEEAEDCWWRVYVEARRRGLGTPAVRTVVVLADGARWIWERARAFLGLPGVEVVEIADIYHAYSYLWAVGNALHGAGTLRAAAWVEPLKDQLYRHGAAPVLAALAALTPTTAEAVQAIDDARTYFTRNAARMDYPRFVARQLPIGSGAVESSCKCLVEARLKQAGMRWGLPGSQAIASLRALQRSGRWAAFWQTHPDQYQPPTEDAAPPTPRVTVTAARPAVTVAPSVSAGSPRVAAPAAIPRAAPRPKPTPAQRPLLLPRSA